VKSVLIVCISAAVLSGCISRKEGSGPVGSQEIAIPADMHTSQNSIDWAGVYEGTLPCADCPGIKTRLMLKRDGSYELSTQYLDRQPAPLVVRGKFSWNAAGNAITLDVNGSGQRYAVGEGRLSLLNRDGTPDGISSPNRVLKLVSPAASTPSVASGLVQTLEDHRWKLESASDGQGQRIEAVSPGPERSFVFSFSGSRLHVQGGCNQLTGGFQINAEGQLNVGSMASSMMACEPALMRADRALSDLLANGMQIDLIKGPPPQLRLVGASKATLILTGQATAEALYGPGTVIFMEVAAQRVSCQNPLNGEAMCLLVRDRQYDQQGLLVGAPGAWRPLYQTIEGFKHTTGVRNVLRIKRFQRVSAPPDPASTVYVLDLMVESETVKR
jgi:heat shock protein HslJ